MSDAVVIGAGPNGLVAANLLADAGWEVTVLEASGVPGGGVHGACGANAARAALNARRPIGRLVTAPALARIDRALKR